MSLWPRTRASDRRSERVGAGPRNSTVSERTTDTPAAPNGVSAGWQQQPARDALARGAVEPSETGTHRALLLVASIALFGPALIAWSSIIQLPLVGAIATAGFALPLALAVCSVVCRSERALGRLDYAVLGVALVLLGSWAATELYFYPAYGTDESAFVQDAASLLLHGHNPYTTNLLPALTQFRVPIQYATYKLNGTIASNLAYPSLSFLLVVPFVLATHGVQAVISEIIVFLAVEMILLFWFLPRSYRALAAIVAIGLPFLFDYSLGGDIITLAMPFMLVVAYRWSDTGRGGQLGRWGIARAVCLGLAGSITQFPWFVVPFLLVGLWRFRSGELGARAATSVVWRFIAIAVGTGLVVNAPFIVWSPHAWLSGVLSPLFQHAIPFGQGLIDATAFFAIGGGNLLYFTGAAVCCLLTLLVCYALFTERLWKAAFILPSVVFLFSNRSLSEYLIMMVAMWIVSVISAGDGPQNASVGPVPPLDPLLTRRWHPTAARLRLIKLVALAVPVAGVLACVALALATPAPLAIRIQSVETNGQFRSIWRIQALVTNRSGHSVAPHFATDASGYMTTFWNRIEGPKQLRPGQHALYTLVAPNVGSMPGVTQPFLLQAVTASPETISTSALFTPEQFDTYISPSYINHLVRFGKSIVVTVQLRSPYGAPIQRPGVPIALGQVIYAQTTLIPSEAVINDAPEGQSPVVAASNDAGLATFHIRDAANQGGNPVYFQAYVDPKNGFPYGYSEVVSVQWTNHT